MCILYLHNKILQYAKLLVRSGRFMIFHIEGSSSMYQITDNIIIVYTRVQLMPLLDYYQFTITLLFFTLVNIVTILHEAIFYFKKSLV